MKGFYCIFYMIHKISVLGKESKNLFTSSTVCTIKNGSEISNGSDISVGGG